MSDEREPTLAEALAFASDPHAVVPAWGRVLAREIGRLQGEIDFAAAVGPLRGARPEHLTFEVAQAHVEWLRAQGTANVVGRLLIVLADELKRLQVNASTTQKVIAELLDAVETMRPQMPPADYEVTVNMFREIERAVTGGGK